MSIMRWPDQGKGDRLLYLRWITNKTCCIAHETVLSVMCQPGWERFWGRTDTCKCMVESPRCSPETTTLLLIDYIPIQNKSLKLFFFLRQRVMGKSLVMRGLGMKYRSRRGGVYTAAITKYHILGWF